MRTMQVREAKAGLSAIIDAAEKGERTTITRHGKPAAVVVSVEDARKLSPDMKRNFGEFLLTFPGGAELERDPSPSRDVDL